MIKQTKMAKDPIQATVTITVLHLTLQAKWFQMISQGEKREEYREIKPYWMKRLIKPEALDNKNWLPSDFKDFDLVLFVHGYGATRPRTCWTVKNIRVGTGNPEWGALPGVVYFIIELGAEVTPPKNQKPT